MSLETRIGIVAGLVIVVVASVYFYYGERHDEAEVLFTSSPAAPAFLREPDAEPVLRIPPSSEPRPAAMDGSQPSGLMPNRPSGPLAEASSSLPDPVAANVPVQSGASARQVAPMIQLRTSPSPQLVEATRDNLEEPPLDPLRLPFVQGDFPRRIEPAEPSATPARGASRETGPPAEAASRREPAFASASVRPSRDASVDGSASSAEPRTHTIESGDTLAQLAQRYLGDARQSATILAANPGLNPRNLRIGQAIVIPERRDASGDRAAKTPPAGRGTGIVAQEAAREYVVQPGDTLYRISASVYEDGSRWSEILEANRELLRGEPRRLKPGMVLRIPL